MQSSFAGYDLGKLGTYQCEMRAVAARQSPPGWENRLLDITQGVGSGRVLTEANGDVQVD